MAEADADFNIKTMNVKSWIIVGVLLLANFIWSAILSFTEKPKDHSDKINELYANSQIVRNNEVKMWEELRKLGEDVKESKRREDSLKAVTVVYENRFKGYEKQLILLRDSYKKTHYQDSSKSKILNVLPN